MTSNRERKYNGIFLDITTDDKMYVTRTDENGNTSIVFGDGKRGSLPPSGIDNTEANLKGIGSSGEVNHDYLKLEDGIEIKFVDGKYKTGDYWFIPARSTKGEIEWPQVNDDSKEIRKKKKDLK